MKQLRNSFFTGLLILLPLVVTLVLFWWGFKKADSILGRLFTRYLGYPIPGLGLVTLLVLITVFGMVAQNYLGKKLIAAGERLLNKIPVLKAVYSTTKQFTSSFTQTERSAFRQMVMVEYPRLGIYSPGFLIGDSPTEACDKTKTRLLSIFMPTVPNPTTGYLILVPHDQVTFLDMSVEEGIKLIVSAGVVRPEDRSGSGNLPNANETIKQS